MAGGAGERPGARSTKVAPADRLATERRLLSPLPARRFDTAYRGAPPGPCGRALDRVGRRCATRCRRPVWARRCGAGSRWTAGIRDPLGRDGGGHPLLAAKGTGPVWDPVHRREAEAAALGPDARPFTAGGRAGATFPGPPIPGPITESACPGSGRSLRRPGGGA